MPTIQDLTPGHAELKEILDVCAQRAHLSMVLPDCATCAHYATDNLPFEALLALLDVLPEGLRPEALAAAEDRLAGMPPALRQQQVDAVTLPIVMDSPDWPLVRSLVIDMAKQAIHKYFADPRLNRVEHKPEELRGGSEMVEAKQFADAVWAGDLLAVEAMIAAGADVNVPEAEDLPPPLHLAIEQQWTEIVRRLIAAGAEVNRDLDSGWGMPLAHAIDIESDAASQRFQEPGHESTELTELLLAAGAVPTEEAFETARAYGNRRALALLERYANRG